MLDDTSLENQRRYTELLAALTPEARLRKVFSLSRLVRDVAVAGLRSRFPNAGDDELRVRLVVLLYGRAFAERIYRDVPADAR